MSILQITGLILTVTALFSFLNDRFLKLTTSIGLMLIALLVSITLIILENVGFDSQLHGFALNILTYINFNDLLMHGMLGLLLFAGAMHINLNDLKKSAWSIAILASLGIALSSSVVAGLLYACSNMLGFGLSFIVCLLFGTLITPTDPIAVLSILKKLGVAKNLETQITGESLFNDGVAVVFFLTVLGIYTGTTEPNFGSISMLILKEAGGGIIFGLEPVFIFNYANRFNMIFDMAI